MENNLERPPTGVTPRNIFYDKVDRSRLDDLSGGIVRYANAQLVIPKEWLEEYNHLAQLIKERNDKDTQR